MIERAGHATSRVCHDPEHMRNDLGCKRWRWPRPASSVAQVRQVGPTASGAVSVGSNPTGGTGQRHASPPPAIRSVKNATVILIVWSSPAACTGSLMRNSSSSMVPVNASQAGSCIRLMMITLSTSLPGPGGLLSSGQGRAVAGPGREMTGHHPGSAPTGIAACRAPAEPRSPGRYRWT